MPSAAELVRLLNPEVEPEEPDINPSNPPPAHTETKPDATVAPKFNHLLPEPEALAPSIANAADRAPVTELRFCIEKMESFTAFVSASLASVLLNSPDTQLPIAFVAVPIALVVCCVVCPNPVTELDVSFVASPTDLSPLTVLLMRTP
ncbi:Uncharacterised protein [Shigella sonnei]|nr:Uncharacterised protein [Shigella sonnei]